MLNWKQQEKIWILLCAQMLYTTLSRTLLVPLPFLLCAHCRTNLSRVVIFWLCNYKRTALECIKLCAVSSRCGCCLLLERCSHAKRAFWWWTRCSFAIQINIGSSVLCWVTFIWLWSVWKHLSISHRACDFAIRQFAMQIRCWNQLGLRARCAIKCTSTARIICKYWEKAGGESQWSGAECV